jgi:hypothetical protein
VEVAVGAMTEDVDGSVMIFEAPEMMNDWVVNLL